MCEFVCVCVWLEGRLRGEKDGRSNCAKLMSSSRKEVVAGGPQAQHMGRRAARQISFWKQGGGESQGQADKQYATYQLFLLRSPQELLGRVADIGVCGLIVWR